LRDWSRYTRVDLAAYAMRSRKDYPLSMDHVTWHRNTDLYWRIIAGHGLVLRVT
jgi:hypothetical protein